MCRASMPNVWPHAVEAALVGNDANIARERPVLASLKSPSIRGAGGFGRSMSVDQGPSSLARGDVLANEAIHNSTESWGRNDPARCRCLLQEPVTIVA